ncbi:XdhC family protein [Ferviditalea candida]|uniref:XdhC family protein n=1 Tax=Ferviditalea candida TaxID=3108399 RepID=A0ABU5ZFW1_9BACL|nr:XdhC family protein [Paenibacillaceae bacterium T2]
MSRIQEARDVFKSIHHAWEQDKQTVLLMITEVRGSAYRQPGAKMMMATGADMFGTLSGGCLESDLWGWAEKVMEEQSPRLQQYDLSENELWSLGIGCKGALEILLAPVEKSDPFWTKMNDMIQAEQPVSLIMEIPSGIRVLLDKDGAGWGDADRLPEGVRQRVMSGSGHRTRAEVVSIGSRRFVIDTMRPSERLIIAGAGHDAVPLVNIAAQVGFNVSVLDSREEYNNIRRFPSATHITLQPSDADPSQFHDGWWIIMNHHQARDEESLALALKSRPRFIGVLGPLSRTKEMLAKIGSGLNSGPLHAPVGFDLGSETIEEVAVSIISQLMAVRNGRQSALPLHGREKIHS